MRLPDFYSALQRRSLPAAGSSPTAVPDEAERDELARAILSVDEAVRLDRPEPFPELDPASAVWAAETLRDLWCAPDQASAAAGSPCPGDRKDARTHYSVDLVFRHLPHVLAVAENAPHRAEAVRRLAAAWPLAAVLVPGATVADPAPVLADSSLRRAYGERILRQRESDRPQDAATERCLEQLLQEHRAFATDVLAHHEELIRRTDI